MPNSNLKMHYGDRYALLVQLMWAHLTGLPDPDQDLARCAVEEWMKSQAVPIPRGYKWTHGSMVENTGSAKALSTAAINKTIGNAAADVMNNEIANAGSMGAWIQTLMADCKKKGESGSADKKTPEQIAAEDEQHNKLWDALEKFISDTAYPFITKYIWVFFLLLFVICLDWATITISEEFIYGLVFVVVMVCVTYTLLMQNETFHNQCMAFVTWFIVFNDFYHMTTTTYSETMATTETSPIFHLSIPISSSLYDLLTVVVLFSHINLTRPDVPVTALPYLNRIWSKWFYSTMQTYHVNIWTSKVPLVLLFIMKASESIYKSFMHKGGPLQVIILLKSKLIQIRYAYVDIPKYGDGSTRYFCKGYSEMSDSSTTDDLAFYWWWWPNFIVLMVVCILLYVQIAVIFEVGSFILWRDTSMGWLMMERKKVLVAPPAHGRGRSPGAPDTRLNTDVFHQEYKDFADSTGCNSIARQRAEKSNIKNVMDIQATYNTTAALLTSISFCLPRSGMNWETVHEDSRILEWVIMIVVYNIMLYLYGTSEIANKDGNGVLRSNKNLDMTYNRGNHFWYERPMVYTPNLRHCFGIASLLGLMTSMSFTNDWWFVEPIFSGCVWQFLYEIGWSSALTYEHAVLHQCECPANQPCINARPIMWFFCQLISFWLTSVVMCMILPTKSPGKGIQLQTLKRVLFLYVLYYCLLPNHKALNIHLQVTYVAVIEPYLLFLMIYAFIGVKQLLAQKQ